MTKQNCTTQKPSKQPRPKNKKYTQQEFINRANEVHNNYYRYDRVVYKNSTTKVEIYCPSCNDYFLIRPCSHLQGQKCGLCRIHRTADSRRRSTKDFIELANKKHGVGRYDYSQVEYTSSSEKIKIRCNVCLDEFYQTASSHLGGKGCAYCAGCKRLTTQQFIEKVVSIYGEGKFSFEKTVYKRSSSKVIITCRKHGDFSTKPNWLLTHKAGCKECANESVSQKNRMPFEEFVRRARERHQNNYEYYKDEYVLSTDKLRIKCKVHGDFFQLGTSHINGHGCKACGSDLNGFGRDNFVKLCDKNNNGNGILYVVECRDGEEVFYKIGITSLSIKKRLNARFPYKYKVLYKLEDSSEYIYNIESKLHSLLKKKHYTPNIFFKGSVYECFTTIKPVEKLLKELSTTEQLQLLA